MNIPHFCEESVKAVKPNGLFFITRYFFWFRRWRLRTGRLPGNSHLKSGEYKHGTLDQSSNPWLYHVNHFLLLDAKRRQWCCTQTSWCYGSNTYRSVYRHFKYVQLNEFCLSCSTDAAMWSLIKIFPVLFFLLSFFLFAYIIWKYSPKIFMRKKSSLDLGWTYVLVNRVNCWLPNILYCAVPWCPLLLRDVPTAVPLH